MPIFLAILGVCFVFLLFFLLSLKNALSEQKQFIANIETRLQERDKNIQDLRENLQNNFSQLTQKTETELKDGFLQTNNVFTDIVKRLSLIDEAQKKIQVLSSNIIDLQTILNDKKSRGAFGEIELSIIIQDLLPTSCYKMQHVLSNGKRADLIIFLPPPTGNIVVDSKFPLENYRLMIDHKNQETEFNAYNTKFRANIKTHINDIAEKYIIPNETANSAIMFLPSESIFNEIQENHYDLVQYAYTKKVWLVSPTTLMAILTTIKAVLKDDATQKQVTKIQKHLIDLSRDFASFNTRFTNFTRHLSQTQNDISEIEISAKKIITQFQKIENVELTDDAQN